MYQDLEGDIASVMDMRTTLYSGKFFAGENFHELQAIRENIIRECLVFC